MRGVWIAAAVLLAGGAVAWAQMGTGPGMGMGQGMGMRGGMMGAPRHYFYMHDGLPSAYAGKTNPNLVTPAVLADGRTLFAANCAACHGPQGRGDGPMATSLTPPPRDLAFATSRPPLGDDFFYWSIAEGGAQFGSAMPAFKGTLKPDQIWAIVAALRSGDLKVK